MINTRQTALWTTRGALAVGAVTLLASCGTTPSANGSGQGQGSYGATQGDSGNGQGFRPGASGQVASVSGSTAEVQNAQLNQQVAVTWTGTTTFSEEVSASKAAVKVGSCVVVSTPTSTSTPSAAATATPTVITAGSVRITQPTKGTCTPTGGRFGGGQGGQPGSGGSQGAPSGAGTGGPGGRGLGAFGKVTAVNATGFTIQSDLGGQASNATVATTGSTTYSTTATATAAAVKVGACVQATGNADSTGAVSATRISVSQPVNGACTSGFGPRG